MCLRWYRAQVYYREAVGAFVVFDITRPKTFENIQKWKKDIDSKVFIIDMLGGVECVHTPFLPLQVTLNDSRPIPVVLLANKVGAVVAHLCVFTGLILW